jgi:hypothetical protein
VTLPEDMETEEKFTYKCVNHDVITFLKVCVIDLSF